MIKISSEVRGVIDSENLFIEFARIRLVTDKIGGSEVVSITFLQDGFSKGIVTLTVDDNGFWISDNFELKISKEIAFEIFDELDSIWSIPDEFKQKFSDRVFETIRPDSDSEVTEIPVEEITIN